MSTAIFVGILTFIIGLFMCYWMHYIFDIYRNLPHDEHLLEGIKREVKDDVKDDIRHLQDDINWLLDRTTKHDGKKRDQH